VILIITATGGGLYLALRPVTLRIAVPGSDDQKLVQALAQIFARERSAVRLSLISTDGGAESISLLAASKSDLAVARGDLEMPTDAESVAILRKNVVVLWAPSGLPVKGSKKPPVPKIKGLEDLAGHRVGIIGRTQANVTLFRVILTESGIAPGKVEVVQFGRNQIAEMARDPTIAAFMAVGPLDSKITIDAIAATARDRGERGAGGDVRRRAARRRQALDVPVRLAARRLQLRAVGAGLRAAIVVDRPGEGVIGRDMRAQPGSRTNKTVRGLRGQLGPSRRGGRPAQALQRSVGHHTRGQAVAHGPGRSQPGPGPVALLDRPPAGTARRSCPACRRPSPPGAP
jgi:hypothetical protein